MQKISELKKVYASVAPAIIPKEITIIFLLMFSMMFTGSLCAGISMIAGSLISSTVFGHFIAMMISVGMQVSSLIISFILEYGFLLMLLRMIRNHTVSLGNLFAGFRQKRTKGTAFMYLIPMLLVFSVTMVPIMLLPDFEKIMTPDGFAEFMQSREQVTHLSVEILVVFLFSFFVIFTPFSLVWLVVYDNVNITAVSAFKTGLRMMKGRFFHFLGFQISINWKYCIFLIVVDVVRYFIAFSERGPASFFGYLFGFFGFMTALFFAANIALAVPFYYESILNEGRR